MIKENYIIWLLRIGLSLVFLLTGYYILTDPNRWTHMLSDRAMELLFINSQSAMTLVAFFDILLGFWLLLPAYTWIAGLLAFLHLIQVLVVSGINGITYRDIGLAFMALAVSWYYWVERQEEKKKALA